MSFQDTIVAAQSVCTAADAMGLGSVYIGAVLECLRELRELLKLPRGVFPVVLVAVGYPKGRSTPREKLDQGMIVHDEAYQDPSDARLIHSFDDKYGGRTFDATGERIEKLARARAAKCTARNMPRPAWSWWKRQATSTWLNVASVCTAPPMRCAAEMPSSCRSPKTQDSSGSASVR
ncbi:MAG: nitroreductase family protein [Clostridia bacterium]|nr:nitroreductase family protein [Clostridia bacterium]